MLENFFQLSPIPANQISGWYDLRLVVLSYLVATFASYIALDITGRLRDISNTQLSVTLWLVGGAFAMGAGIWSMHFIGMLAFNMPMPMSYDPAWTALSMVVAIAASGFALFILKFKSISFINIFIGGIVLGFAIAAMHYTGMAAMTNIYIHYLPSLWIVSILVAIFASEAALWLAIKSTEVLPAMRFRLKFVSAFIMGAAISGMHYTGMAAAIFTPTATMSSMKGALDPELMSITIATVTFIILGIAFVVSTYKESLNQQLLLTARQAGMAEVAASVLHNVGNVLNSINVSTSLLNEKVENSKMSSLNDLNQLINEHKNNFAEFIQKDSQGSQIPEFINSLSEYWRAEQAFLSAELQTLNKNVEHVKNIIATQQDLSRISDSEQVVAIENVIEESLLISGLENVKHAIQIEKKYEPLKPVLIDKVKLMQIMVNLLQNAKESFHDETEHAKKIRITLTHDKTCFIIAITDSGSGIQRENLVKIFAYGFTTKKEGHGFGLHTSAIFAKEMGGRLSVASEGLGKGSTFYLKLPYKYT